MIESETLEARTLFTFPITFGGSLYDTVSKVIATPDGGTVVAGLFTGTADFDPTSRVVSRTTEEDRADAFIARYTAAGRLSWVRQFSSEKGEINADGTIDTPTDPQRAGSFDLGVGRNPGNLGIYMTAISLDSLGNIYFAGGFLGSVNFQKAPKQQVLTSAADGTYLNGFFGRLNAGGNLSFVRQIAGRFTTLPNAMALDSSNNVYLTGYFTRTANFNVTGGVATRTTRGREDIFTAKYDPVGRLRWVNTSSTDEGDRVKRSAGNSIAVDSSGSVYIAGVFGGETRFVPTSQAAATTLEPVDKTDAFVEKFNANGTLAWVKAFGGEEYDGATALTLSPDGSKVYVGSYFEDTIDANPGPAIQRITATPEDDEDDPERTDLLLSSFNTSNGSLAFAKILVGGEGWETLGGLVTDSAGNIYASGGFYDRCFFGGAAGTTTITSPERDEKFHDPNDGDRDFAYSVFLSKLSANGTLSFVTSFGSASDNFATALALNTSGQPMVAGQFRGVYFFPSTSQKLRPIGGQDGFVALFSDQGALLS